jgi:hypothetical protein
MSEVKPELLSYDYPVAVPASVYRLLDSLLKTGTLEQSGVTLDFSGVQTITIADGKMSFNPPPKVSATMAGVAIRTTVSSLTAGTDGIKVEVDNSPINVEIQPQ